MSVPKTVHSFLFVIEHMAILFDWMDQFTQKLKFSHALHHYTQKLDLNTFFKVKIFTASLEWGQELDCRSRVEILEYF